MKLQQQLCLLAIVQIYVIIFSISICLVSHLIAAYNVEIIVYNLSTYVSTIIVPIATISCVMFGILLIPIIVVDDWIRNIENTDN